MDKCLQIRAFLEGEPTPEDVASRLAQLIQYMYPSVSDLPPSPLTQDRLPKRESTAVPVGSKGFNDDNGE